MSYTFEARPKRKLSVALGLAFAAAALIAGPSQALAAGSGGLGTGGSGGASSNASDAPTGTTPGARAKLVRGYAVAPESAPNKVKRAIEAANKIVKGKSYCLGGGHGRWESRCYDCSGTISYALGKKGARVLDAPMPSGSFMDWEKGGRGDWITVYANGGHMYAVIAGLRLDTSQTTGDGPGWSKVKLHQRGYEVRHPRRF